MFLKRNYSETLTTELHRVRHNHVYFSSSFCCVGLLKKEVGEHFSPMDLLIWVCLYSASPCDVQDAQMPQAHGCAGAAGEKLLIVISAEQLL